MIRHIIFDFGGVILNLEGKHSGISDDLAEIFGLPLEKVETFWNKNKVGLLTGKVSVSDFIQSMAHHFSLVVDEENIHKRWTQRNSITEESIDWKLINFIEKLKKKYSVHLLTDQIALDNGSATWKHKIEDNFHTFFRSYEQGYRKPDAEAFLNVLQKIEAQPAECVFIDDAAHNIAAAHQLGIQTILYKFGSSIELVEKLQRHGITV